MKWFEENFGESGHESGHVDLESGETRNIKESGTPVNGEVGAGEFQEHGNIIKIMEAGK